MVSEDASCRESMQSGRECRTATEGIPNATCTPCIDAVCYHLLPVALQWRTTHPHLPDTVLGHATCEQRSQTWDEEAAGGRTSSSVLLGLLEGLAPAPPAPKAYLCTHRSITQISTHSSSNTQEYHAPFQKIANLLKAATFLTSFTLD